MTRRDSLNHRYSTLPHRELQNYGMSGEGIFDMASKMFGKATQQRYVGEKHTKLLTNRGFKTAEFMGPSTFILRRTKENIQPLTESDRVAQAHDLRYALATSPEDIRKADRKMIKKLGTVNDNLFNRQQGKKGIQAKVAAERAGLMKKGSFWDPEYAKSLSFEDKEILKNKLKGLKQKGYGHKMKPADKLKLRLIGKMVRDQRKRPKLKGDGCRAGCKKTKGGALKQGGMGLEDFIKKVALPTLEKKLKMKVKRSKPLMSAIKKVKNIQQASKVLVPALINHAIPFHKIKNKVKGLKHFHEAMEKTLSSMIGIVNKTPSDKMGGDGFFSSMWHAVKNPFSSPKAFVTSLALAPATMPITVASVGGKVLNKATGQKMKPSQWLKKTAPLMNTLTAGATAVPSDVLIKSGELLDM